MKEPRTSMHVIFFMGMACLGIMVVFLLMSLQGLQESKPGTPLQLANLVTASYTDILRTHVGFVEGEESTVLQVAYETKRYTAYDLEVQEEEMKAVAKFVYQASLKYEDPELYKTEQIGVKRTEIFGSGCQENRFESSYTLEIPRRVPKEDR